MEINKDQDPEWERKRRTYIENNKNTNNRLKKAPHDFSGYSMHAPPKYRHTCADRGIFSTDDLLRNLQTNHPIIPRH